MGQRCLLRLKFSGTASEMFLFFPGFEVFLLSFRLLFLSLKLLLSGFCYYSVLSVTGPFTTSSTVQPVTSAANLGRDCRHGSGFQKSPVFSAMALARAVRSDLSGEERRRSRGPSLAGVTKPVPLTGSRPFAAAENPQGRASASPERTWRCPSQDEFLPDEPHAFCRRCRRMSFCPKRYWRRPQRSRALPCRSRWCFP